MTRHEIQQLAAIWRDLAAGRDNALDCLQILICNAALDLVLEDQVNTALEQSKGADHDQRSV